MNSEGVGRLIILDLEMSGTVLLCLVSSVVLNVQRQIFIGPCFF